MNEVDQATDLYDLFGETSTCVVCQDEIQEGERVRAIQKCSHIFHAACIEPWLLRKRECPLCRVSIGSPPPVSTGEQVEPIVTHLQNLLAQNPTTRFTVPPSQNTLQNIAAILDRFLVDSSDMARRRTFLTFCLIDGILRKYTTAGAYTPHRETIRGILNSYQIEDTRPMPIDLSNFTTLKRARDTMRDKCVHLLSYTGSPRTFRNRTEIRSMNEKIQTHSPAPFLTHWLG
jgi:hypothetical protein